MIIKRLQKTAVAVCDLSNIVMFWIFSKTSRIERFKISPLRFVFYPAIALSVLINTIIDVLAFAKTNNKNVLNVSGTMATLISGTCAVIANGGGLIAALFFNVGFPLGVYFILTGVGTAFLFHFSQVALKLTRFLLSPSYSQDLSAQKQMLALHTFYSGMLFSIFFGLLFTTLIPINTFFPALTILFFTVDCIWSALLSDDQKNTIKNFFSFNHETTLPFNEKESLAWQKQRAINPALFTFFQPSYHHDTVKAHLIGKNEVTAKAHLLEVVTLKKQHMQNIIKSNPLDKKHQHKLNILNEIDAHLTYQNQLNHDKLKQLCATNYLAKQSFFSMAEGDMGDIIEATKLYMEPSSCSHQSVQQN